MTNEEARRILIQNTESLKANPLVTVDDCLYEAFDIAVKALEQPSKNVINKIKKSITNKMKLVEGSTLPCEYNDALQDVLKIVIEIEEGSKGKWIKIQSGDGDFPESIVCSRCNRENSHLDLDEHSVPIGKVFVTSKYCPNCGAEMEDAE